MTDNQGSQGFIHTFSLRPYVLISNDCTCANEKQFVALSRVMDNQIQLAITSFSAGEFCRQPALSDNPGANFASRGYSLMSSVRETTKKLASILKLQGSC